MSGYGVGYEIVEEAEYGTVNIEENVVTYNHDSGGSEEDYFYYQVSDGVTLSARAEVRIVIIQSNDRPEYLRISMRRSKKGRV